MCVEVWEPTRHTRPTCLPFGPAAAAAPLPAKGHPFCCICFTKIYVAPRISTAVRSGAYCCEKSEITVASVAEEDIWWQRARETRGGAGSTPCRPCLPTQIPLHEGAVAGRQDDLIWALRKVTSVLRMDRDKALEKMLPPPHHHLHSCLAASPAAAHPEQADIHCCTVPLSLSISDTPTSARPIHNCAQLHHHQPPLLYSCRQGAGLLSHHPPPACVGQPVTATHRLA